MLSSTPTENNYHRAKNEHPQIKSEEWGPNGALGLWGDWVFIFRELGSLCNYFQGFWEQAHSLGDLGSPAKK